MNRKKIKILYTIPNFDTAGSGRVVYDLVNNLDNELFDPEICCFHGKGAYFNTVKELGIKIHLFSFTANYRPFITFPFRVFKIVKFFKKHRFDIIHSWHWSSDFSEPLAAKLAGIPFIYTKKSMGWGNKAWKWRSALSSAIVTVNSDMLRSFFKNYSVKLSHIPIGVDIAYYHLQEKSYRTPEKLKFEKEDFILVCVANLLPIKGVEILIKAIIELNDTKNKLCIVGNDTGEYATHLKKLGAGYSNIYFLGKKSDVRPYHAIADVCVIPSLELGEGLPIAPLEAMSSARIVIGSNVSGVKDILATFPNCIFKPNNVANLKKKILEIQKLTKKEKSQLQGDMRSSVLIRFSKEMFIERHEKLYKELVS